MSHTSLSVVIEQSQLTNFSEIVRQCELAGMVVQRRMITLGVISGTIDATRLNDLNKIEGVHAVEPARQVQCLKPSDSAPR